MRYQPNGLRPCLVTIARKLLITKNATDERHGKADGDVEHLALGQRAGLVVQLQDGGAHHGGHRQVEGEKRRRPAVHAQKLATQDGGAGARHARNDGYDLATADLERLGQGQLVAFHPARLGRDAFDKQQDHAAHDPAGGNEGHGMDRIEQHPVDHLLQGQPHHHRRQQRQDQAQRETPRLRRAGKADQRPPEHLEIDRHHRQDGAQLDHHGEGFPLVTQPQQPFGHQKMGGRGNGQEFGDTFDDPQDHGQQHIVHGESRSLGGGGGALVASPPASRIL